jgi:hypothetical protein
MSTTLSQASSSSKSSQKETLDIRPHFSSLNVHPFDEIDWEFRDIRMENANGEVIFKQAGVEVPAYFVMPKKSKRIDDDSCQQQF